MPCVSPQVIVEGQANAVPLSSIALPTISNASFATGGVTVASTLGGTLLDVTGTNFGATANYTQVAIRVPAGDLLTSNCTLTSFDTRLQCALPMATGAISLVNVTVLGQTSSFVPSGLAYAPPNITNVAPGSLPTTGATLQITGSNFGSTVAPLVLLVNGAPVAATMSVRGNVWLRWLCDGGGVVDLATQSMHPCVCVSGTGLLQVPHTTLQLRLDDVSGLTSLTLVAVVSGQPSNAVVVVVTPPALTAVRLYDTASLVSALSVDFAPWH